MARRWRRACRWRVTSQQALSSLVVMLVASLLSGAEPLPLTDGEGPGLVAPAQPAKAQVLIVDWGGELGELARLRSLIVIGPAPVIGRGQTTPAMVGTWELLDGGAFQVAHPGVAYRSADGRLHIRCHQLATWTAPGTGWYPDSFALDVGQAVATGHPVEVLDDRGNTSVGRVLGQVDAVDDPAAWRRSLNRILGEGNRVW